LLGPGLDASEARIERDIEQDRHLQVRADRRLLVHALVNLLKNALEAAAEHGISPRITYSARRDGTTVWIGISDNGPGIPVADLRHVFDDGYSTKGSGRGRGLAIVRESIHVQGGEIRVSCPPGGGTRFQIGLPLAQDD
jgi:C4-dicarboxylate-specific signal transduction histidine kinase